MTDLNLPNEDWPLKRRVTRRSVTPYGYMISPDDEYLYVPVPEMVKNINEALDHIDAGNSLRSVAEWLSEKNGKYLSHMGLSNIWKRIRGDARKNPRAKQLLKVKKAKAPKTPEERVVHAAKMKAATAKRSIIAAKKRIDKAAEVIGTPINNKPVDPVRQAAAIELAEYNTRTEEVVFKPNEGPQTDFLASWEQEVLYGGAAGGGKSYSMLADPMRYFGNPNFNGILFRKTNDELRELIMKSQQLYPKAYPGAKWAEKKSEWTFPSGAHMWFTYLDRDEDVERYQGQAFTWVGFDELGHWATPYAWDYMRSRLRSTDPTIDLAQRGSANPGGIGMWWIKRLFVDPAPPNETFNATDIEGNVMVYPERNSQGEPHPKAGQPLFQRKFIPARLHDNPYLYADGRYEASLLSLPENKRRQLLDGDWTISDGAAFPEFRIQTHVIEPFEIPSDWRKFRSCDYGYSSFSCVHWFCIDPIDETLILYRELYVSKHTGKDLAGRVLEVERGEKILYGVLDSSVWHQRGQTGPSIAEEMIMAGCHWRPADRSSGSRANGKNRLHEVLKPRQVGADLTTGAPIMRPALQIFNNCRQIIADLPIIPTDPNGKDDIDERYASDHSYDALRYGIMSRPRASSPFDFDDATTLSSSRPSDRIFGY